MLLWFLHLFSFDNNYELITVEWNVLTDDSSRAGKACHVTIPTEDKTHETEPKSGWQSKLCLRVI